MADPEHEHREEETAAGEDEDTGAPASPIVRLEEVAVTTGEEDEDAILDMRSKLYRFDREGNQWKERGAGTVKLLKHREWGKVRLVMRQSMTLKICANHLVLPTMSVQEHAENEKSCVWHATDFADGVLRDELFCIRFGSIENCKTFIEMFQDVAASAAAGLLENNEDASAAAGLLENNEDASAAAGLLENNEDASAAAGLLENLSVEDKKSEDNASEGVPVASKADKESEGEPVKADAENKNEKTVSST